MKKKYKIISKARFYLSLITVLVICSIAIISFLPRGRVHSLSYEKKYNQVEVAVGDTLWSIALNHLPKDTDIRKLIYDINELNGIKSSHIYPGDIIKIPIY